MRTLILFLYLFLNTAVLYAHHPASSSVNMFKGNFDPSMGKSAGVSPSITLNEQYQQSERDYRHVLVSEIFAEVPLYKDRIGLMVSGNHYYFNQLDNKDAARYGRGMIGLRFVPYIGKRMVVSLESSLYFPAGTDQEKFYGGTYYFGLPGISVGFMLSEKFAFFGSLKGYFPMSRPDEETARVIELKKTTEWTGTLHYTVNGNFGLFTGAIYRKPFHIMEIARETEYDSVYREGFAGMRIAFGDVSVNLSWHRPFKRDEDKPYDSSTNLSVSFLF